MAVGAEIRLDGDGMAGTPTKKPELNDCVASFMLGRRGCISNSWCFFRFVWHFSSRAMSLGSFHWQVPGLGCPLHARGILVRLQSCLHVVNSIQSLVYISHHPQSQCKPSRCCKYNPWWWGRKCRNVPVCGSTSTTWGWDGANQHHWLQTSEWQCLSKGRAMGARAILICGDSWQAHRDSPQSLVVWLVWRCVRFPVQEKDGVEHWGMSCHFFLLPKHGPCHRV